MHPMCSANAGLVAATVVTTTIHYCIMLRISRQATHTHTHTHTHRHTYTHTHTHMHTHTPPPPHTHTHTRACMFSCIGSCLLLAAMCNIFLAYYSLPCAISFPPTGIVQDHIDGRRHEGQTQCYILNPVVGPEALTGSTRMKGGSATKIVLVRLRVVLCIIMLHIVYSTVFGLAYIFVA